MRKLALFAVMGLLLSTAAIAEVMVLQDGKIMSFREGSQVIVSSKTPARVLYNGVLIIVPAGQKVQVSKKDGKIWVSGTNMKGVEVSGQSISSNGQAIIAVSPDTMEISSVKGDVSIVKNEVILTHKSKIGTKNKQQTAAKPTQTTVAAATEIASFPEISDYVNEVNAQQSAQDVTDMSQSSPSGI